jgi:hypothetical protein
MDILSKCFVKKEDCVSREIAGETLIVPVRSHVGDVNAIYTLNELGAMVWKLMDGRTSVSQIVEAVCEAYAVAPDKATEDVAGFLSSLEAAGLIEDRPKGPSAERS